MAIMGFGGGALIASPLSSQLLAVYDSAFDPSDPTTVASGDAVMKLSLTLAVVYFLVMMLGVFNVRVPAPECKPAGFDPAKLTARPMITSANVSANNAVKTPQF